MQREDIHLDGYTITFDRALSSVYFQLPPEFTQSFINNLRERVFEGSPDTEEVLSKLTQGYPNYPFAFVLLAFHYLKQEEIEEASEIVKELNQAHPGYFWSVYLQGFIHIQQGETLQLATVFGDSLQIEDTFPSVQAFHIEEYLLYQSLVGTYYLETQQIDKANEHLALLKSIAPEHDRVNEYAQDIRMKMLQQDIQETQERLKNDFRYLDPDYKSPVETVVRSTPKVGRNDPCPCGSGKKYKKCCLT